MALKALFLLLMTCSCALGCYSPHCSSLEKCLQSLPGVDCRCGFVNKTIQVFCSCLSVKTLDLRNFSQEYLVTEATAFYLGNCKSTSVLVFPEAFSYLSFLERITFHNVGRLTLEPYSINIKSWAENVFTLTFSLITNLSIRKDAINIQPEDQHEGVNMSVRIKHSTLISLMKSAIVGNLEELIMEEMLVKAKPWPGAVVCQGLAGASVTMKSVTTKKGLSGRWITGNISLLQITRSNLRLLPDAFAGVKMVEGQKSQAGIVLIGNNFMVPSLPSHALPSDGVLLRAQKNHIVCQCQNLAWLLEPPKTTLKKGVKNTLICRNRILDSVLASCETHALSTV